MNTSDLKEILIKTTKIFAGQSVKVYCEGFAPRVEYNAKTQKPERIYIPTVPENASSDLIAAIHGYIDHECSHIYFSDAGDICDKEKSKLWHYIHNCIEDPRVNKLITNKFPGCGRNVRNGYNYLFNNSESYTKEAIDAFNLKDATTLTYLQMEYSSLWFARKSNCPFSSNKYDELEMDRVFGNIEAKMEPAKIDALTKVETAEDVSSLATYFENFFSKDALEAMNSQITGEDSGKKRTITQAELESFTPTDLEDKLAKKIDIDIKCDIKKEDVGIYLTDEFDQHYNKTDIINKHGFTDFNKLEDSTRQVANYIMKDLQRFVEDKRRQYYIGGFKSGKLNPRSLYSVRMGNDRIFKKKSEIRFRNASVGLLIDLSGSMGGKKAQVAIQSAYALALTLHRLKVPFEIYGFTNTGSTRLNERWRKYQSEDPTLARQTVNTNDANVTYQFKGFEEAFDIRSKSALATAFNSEIYMSQNEDSFHVKSAIERLSRRPEPIKALFVFSDGYPAFHTATKLTLCTNNLIRFVEEAKPKYGVDVYSIGITSDSVKHFYKNFKVVNRLDDLPKALFEFLRKVV